MVSSFRGAADLIAMNTTSNHSDRLRKPLQKKRQLRELGKGRVTWDAVPGGGCQLRNTGSQISMSSSKAARQGTAAMKLIQA